MKWFTSDWHFGHRNITGPELSNWSWGYRDFKTIEEMDEEILHQINSNVEEPDELYFLGDFMFSGNFKEYLDQIKCKNIFWILGNHDEERFAKKQVGGKIKSVTHYLETFIETSLSKYPIRVCMSHYAHRVWNNSHRGSFHIYGHSHNSIDNDWGRSIDVGIDSAKELYGLYKPISEKELVDLLLPRQYKKVDGHGEV